MPDSTPDEPSAGIQKPFVQIPKDLIRYARSLKLTGTQYDLWLYLWELDPFGDRWIEVPPPEEIALLLKVDPRTIQRAAQRLDDCELFEFQIKGWKARNTSVSVRSRDFSTDKEIRIATKRSKKRQKDPNVENGINLSENGQNDPNVEMKPASGKGSGSLHTIHTYSDSLRGAREREGDEQETALHPDCFELTGDGSLEITSAYEEWLRSKAKRLPEPPTLIEQWIETQAVLEANQRQFLQELGKYRNGSHVPPPVPDQFQIESSITMAILNGDRSFVLAKLERLWADGWHDMVREMLHLRQDWGFAIRGDCVVEVEP